MVGLHRPTMMTTRSRYSWEFGPRHEKGAVI